MGKVIAIIIIVALGGFMAYELISLVVTIVKKFKKRKQSQNNDMEKDEKEVD